MKNLKNILKYVFSKKVIIISIILILVLVILFPIAYFLTCDEAIFDENESGKPSSYTQNVQISSENGVVGLIVDKDTLIKNELKNLGYTDKEIEKLKDEEIIEILGINEKLRKNPKVTSLDDVTQAELLWCLNEVYSKYLDTPEELEKLLNAEIITQYPKIGQGNAELDGIIQFKRYKTDGKSAKLTYIDLETFNDYVDSGNKKALEHFTLDDNENALIAVLNTTTETITSNDSEININEYTQNLDDSNKSSDGSYKKTETKITTLPIDYKKNVQKYTMPFQYLWALLVISEDKEFVLELADLVEDSEITISIYDNINTTINTDEYTYFKQTKTETYVSLFIPNTFGVSSVPAKGYWIAEDSQWANQYGNKYPADYSEATQYKVTHTITNKTNSPIIDLTKADVWIVDYSKEYEYQKSENTSTETNETSLEDTEYVLAPGSPRTSENDSSLLNCAHALQLVAEAKQYIETNRQTTSNSSENSDEVVVGVTRVECNSYNHVINRNKKTTVKVDQQKYVAQTPVKKDKVEKDDEEPNFVNILCDGTHNKAKKLISSEVTSWLFEILESSDDTKDMVELTKYLLNKVIGKEKFKADFDFSEFSDFDFSSFQGVSGGSGTIPLYTPILTKEQFIEAMENYQTSNSAFNTNFRPNAEEIYDVAVANNVNPELVVVTACCEGGFKETGGSYNYWGLGVPNGASSGAGYLTLKDGIAGYASGLHSIDETDWKVELMRERAEARKAAGCDPLGYGEPGTLSGHQSIYSWLGDNHTYGSSGDGGYYYLDPSRAGVDIYSSYDEFVEKCKNVHSEGSPTTVWEQGEYTAWQVRQKIKVWNKIFGNYGSLQAINSNGSFLEIAKQCHDYLREYQYWYPSSANIRAGGYVSDGKPVTHRIPTIGDAENERYVDCSAYVSWVLTLYGYKGLWSSGDLLSNPFGFEEVSVSQAQPGDILVRSSHTEIYIGDGKSYNCGSTGAIRAEYSNCNPNSFSIALRVPTK